MTEAETIELITKKRNELEEKRARRASSALLKSLEDEIKALESGLAGEAPKKKRKTVFLDECAG